MLHQRLSTILGLLAFIPPFAKAQVATSPFFSNPPGQPLLPSLGDGTSAAQKFGLNLSNIQSETLVGMKKRKELFFFFRINQATAFKQNFGSKIFSKITPTISILASSTTPNTSVNVAFSQEGLRALNISGTFGEGEFAAGMASAATALGDPGTTNWVPQFTRSGIHGVFLIATNNILGLNKSIKALQLALGTSISEVYRLQGSVRPGGQEGHEPFGFLDGISQPAVQGFVLNPLPGQTVVPQGQILLGHGTGTAPAWAKDSSFLVFRQLKQLVPEFHKFLANNPLKVPGLNTTQGSALLGARIVGRWPSGAPVDLAPRIDDPALGADPRRNNNFTFAHSDPGFSLGTNQSYCPFSAHIRKTHPRADLPGVLNGEIVRAGIPYGPEVTAAEALSGVSNNTLERGLAFVAYQSVISNGFAFLQETWADNKNFVHPGVGVDPIIGSSQLSPPTGQRVISGLDPTNFSRTITFTTDFVVSRGGEYFLSPSISALQTHFSA